LGRCLEAVRVSSKAEIVIDSSPKHQSCQFASKACVSLLQWPITAEELFVVLDMKRKGGENMRGKPLLIWNYCVSLNL
jgi:hypothetical protein